MEQNILIVTAASLGFFHTLLGPDHYIPFIALSKARGWAIRKTILITVLCGAGHVLSSVLLGIAGIASGIALEKLELVESFRGSIAAWLLILFGLGYLIYGIRRIFRDKPHRHVHGHSDGTIHNHEHTHANGHVHVHESRDGKKLTPWILFIIFVFGPCEVLIPLVMYPAAQGNYSLLIVTTLVFAVTTVFTMVGIVLVSLLGIRFIRLTRVEKYVHALAGILILACGLAIQFLGI